MGDRGRGRTNRQLQCVDEDVRTHGTKTQSGVHVSSHSSGMNSSMQLEVEIWHMVWERLWL